MKIRLLQYSDIEHAYDDPERLGRLAGLIETHHDARTLVVGTGDNISPSVLSIATEGRQAIDFFDQIQPEVATAGNHDLDFGLAPMLEVVRESPQTWVCSNVRIDGQLLGAEAGVVSSAIRTVAGQHLGFFGLLDPETAAKAPVSEELSITPPVETARRVSDELRKKGADHVIALAHTKNIEAIAQSVDIDVILAGHVHSDRLTRIDGTLVTRPGVGGEFLMEATFEDGAWTGKRLTVDDAPLRTEVQRAFDHSLPPEYRCEVATLNRPLDRTAEPAEDVSSHVGYLVADAYRRETAADIGLQHSAGIRAGPPLTGTVTIADLVGVIPYQDPVVVVELSGDELEAVVTQFTSASDAPDAYLSGETVAQTSKGASVPVVGGADVVSDTTYTLATTEYLIHSEDLQSVLGDDTPVVSTGRTQYNVLIEHVRHGGLENLS